MRTDGTAEPRRDGGNADRDVSPESSNRDPPDPLRLKGRLGRSPSRHVSSDRLHPDQEGHWFTPGVHTQGFSGLVHPTEKGLGTHRVTTRADWPVGRGLRGL